MPTKVSSVVAVAAGRVAALLGPRGMRVVARVNKYVTNPIQLMWAPRLRHYAVIEHVGRRSGKTYRTPVMVFVEDGTVSVLLNYGAGSDWVRNVRAAGAAGVVHRGKRYRLTEPRIVSSASAELPLAARGGGQPERSALVGTLTLMGK